MSLVDIANAFIQSGRLLRQSGRLFVEMPRGDLLLGVPEGSLIELLAPAYGLNDAPACFNRELVACLTSTGWEPLSTEPCCFVLREPPSQSPSKKAGAGSSDLISANHSPNTTDLSQAVNLAGLILLHVDDVLMAGRGEWYRSRVAALKNRFEIGS